MELARAAIEDNKGTDYERRLNDICNDRDGRLSRMVRSGLELPSDVCQRWEFAVDFRVPGADRGTVGGGAAGDAGRDRPGHPWSGRFGPRSEGGRARQRAGMLRPTPRRLSPTPASATPRACRPASTWSPRAVPGSLWTSCVPRHPKAGEARAVSTRARGTGRWTAAEAGIHGRPPPAGGGHLEGWNGAKTRGAVDAPLDGVVRHPRMGPHYELHWSPMTIAVSSRRNAAEKRRLWWTRSDASC